MFFTPVRVSRSVLNGYADLPSAWARAAYSRPTHAAEYACAGQQSEVSSDEGSITLSLDVPGLAKDQLTIGIEGRVVRIRSKDDAPRSFQAAYKLGADVDLSQSSAKLEHGVLTLKFKKVAPESRETLLAID
jgi:HSP20 family protein